MQNREEQQQIYLLKKLKELFNKDAEITNYYNNILADGKWNHMMDQTHIGYTNWQQPDKNIMPEVKEINIPDEAEMGVSIEGSEKCWLNTPNDSCTYRNLINLISNHII